MERLGDLLIHEGFIVHDVLHHHPQVKHLQDLCDLGDLHQVLLLLVQLTRVEEAQDGAEGSVLDGMIHLHHGHEGRRARDRVDRTLFVDAVEGLAPGGQRQSGAPVRPAETHHLEGPVTLGRPERARRKVGQNRHVLFRVQAKGAHELVPSVTLGHHQALGLVGEVHLKQVEEFGG